MITDDFGWSEQPDFAGEIGVSSAVFTPDQVQRQQDQQAPPATVSPEEIAALERVSQAQQQAEAVMNSLTPDSRRVFSPGDGHAEHLLDTWLADIGALRGPGDPAALSAGLQHNRGALGQLAQALLRSGNGLHERVLKQLETDLPGGTYRLVVVDQQRTDGGTKVDPILIEREADGERQYFALTSKAYGAHFGSAPDAVADGLLTPIATAEVANSVIAAADASHLVRGAAVPPQIETVLTVANITGLNRLGRFQGQHLPELILPRVQAYLDFRGNEPRTFTHDQDLRAEIALAMGIPADQVPQSEEELAAFDRGEWQAWSDTAFAPAQAAYEQIRALGGATPQVEVLPIALQSDETGVVPLSLFAVSDNNGERRFVDLEGRVYQDVADWKAHNTLPPGQVGYPEDLQLQADAEGRARLTIEATHATIDTPGEQAKEWLDRAVVAGRIAVGAALLYGSAGSLAPVAIPLTLYTGVEAGRSIVDRATHRQSLNPIADPGARMDWFDLAGSAAGLAAMGLSVAARSGKLGVAFSGWAMSTAQSLSSADDVIDFADALNTGQTLTRNWDELSPDQRFNLASQLVFWGGRQARAFNASRGAEGGLPRYSSLVGQRYYSGLPMGEAGRSTDPDLRIESDFRADPTFAPENGYPPGLHLVGGAPDPLRTRSTVDADGHTRWFNTVDPRLNGDWDRQILALDLDQSPDGRMLISRESLESGDLVVLSDRVGADFGPMHRELQQRILIEEADGSQSPIGDALPRENIFLLEQRGPDGQPRYNGADQAERRQWVLDELEWQSGREVVSIDGAPAATPRPDMSAIVHPTLTGDPSKPILVLDIDDTALQVGGRPVRRIAPDGSIDELSTTQYAEIDVELAKRDGYRFEFEDDPDLVQRSLEEGTPIIPNLEILDQFLDDGADLVILTARPDLRPGMLYEALQNKLTVRNANGDLEPIGERLRPENIFGVNTRNGEGERIFPGETDAIRKQNVLRELSIHERKVFLLDDDYKNLNSANELARSENLPIFTWAAETQDRFRSSTFYDPTGTVIEEPLRVYQRQDILWHQVDPDTGLNNLQRAQRGDPPLGRDGEAVRLWYSTSRDGESVGPVVEILGSRYSDDLAELSLNPQQARSDLADNADFRQLERYYWSQRAQGVLYRRKYFDFLQGQNPTTPIRDGAGEEWQQREWTPQAGIFPAGQPKPLDPSRSLQVLDDQTHVVLYDPERRAPVAAAYYLPPEFPFDDSSYRRGGRFQADSRVEFSWQHDDWKHSGYDRGHLVPSRGMHYSFGREGMLRTYNSDQITPQSPDMNRGPWQAGERIERQFALNDHLRSPASSENPNEHGIWVIDGPIYGDNPPTVGRNKLPIPEAHYKIIIDQNEVTGETQILPLIVPQEVRHSGSRLSDYVTTVDEIERRTGLDFNPLMPKDLQQALESRQPDADYWQTDRLLIPSHLEKRDVLEVLDDRFGVERPALQNIRSRISHLRYKDQQDVLPDLLREAYISKSAAEFNEQATEVLVDAGLMRRPRGVEDGGEKPILRQQKPVEDRQDPADAQPRRPQDEQSNRNGDADQPSPRVRNSDNSATVDALFDARRIGGTEGLQRLDNTGYSVFYDPELRSPIVAVYEVAGAPPFGNAPRPSFSADTRVENPIMPSDYQYSQTGQSRGHLVTRSTLQRYYGAQGNVDSMLMTNMIPQYQHVNGGAILDLENDIKNDFGIDFDKVRVFVGPIYDKQPPDQIGNGVPLPTGTFMVIADEMPNGTPRALAVAIPNRASGVDGNWKNHIVTVDEIEDRTGLDFFPDLPAGVEDAMEAQDWAPTGGFD